jgi:hypothetical protein
MDEKPLKKILADILSKVSDNTSVSDDLQKDVKLVVELVHGINQRVSDISMKVDQFLNAGAKKPKAIPKKITTKLSSEKGLAKKAPAKKKTPAKKASPDEEVDDIKNDNDEEDDINENINSTEITPIGQIKNILSYFKTRHGEDSEYFNEHLEDNQAESLFAEHEDVINSKKSGDIRTKFKSTLLYKNLTKSQKEKVREMKISEQEQADADNSNDLEPEDKNNDSD